MTDSEMARELFLGGYNCAQSVVGAYCQKCGIDMKTAMMISSPFGGGMGRMREVCGAVSGMFIIAGLKAGYYDPKDKKAKAELYSLIQKLASDFKEANGSIICRELLSTGGCGDESESGGVPSDRTPEYYKKRPCDRLVKCAAEILEKNNII